MIMEASVDPQPWGPDWALTAAQFIELIEKLANPLAYPGSLLGCPGFLVDTGADLAAAPDGAPEFFPE
jgi:hypothetical protein